MGKSIFPFETDPPGGGGDEEGDTGEDDAGSQEDTIAGGAGDEQGPNPEIAKVRREAAKYRTERNTLRKRVEELEAAQKSELELAQEGVTKLTETNSTLVTANRALRVRVLGEEVGITRDARGDAAALLDWSSIEDPDDDAQVTSALKSLLKEKPYLRGGATTGADGGAGSRRAEPADMNALLRSRTGRT